MQIDFCDGGFRVKIDDKKTMTNSRTTDLIIGNKYVIVPPLNSKQKSNLGRECIIESFIENWIGYSDTAVIRYVDNNRIGRASFRNLAYS